MAAAGTSSFAAGPATADGDQPPDDSGRWGRRYVIRSGAVMSMAPDAGNFAVTDILVESSKIDDHSDSPGTWTWVEATESRCGACSL
ncbi:hypothetical protein [Amycolatopsis sp. 195334CR]|uniref:hypothetical protein n=1 Tax=Amycolatopsis sp. 195334CR TaxID=2814588 RepID=UPI001A8F796F|nr:hypothetical protein [Amycolatopsis sp. 195334CR]MBN6039101.1 hypothetical protein [Amycolatopsis sp. 195334CR]